MSDFYQNVYKIVRKIPKGRVTSYGSIAKALGVAKSARMVGYAMNHSHSDDSIPAHRVVNRNGLLTGRHSFNPPEKMQLLLEKEGLKIKNNKIMEFDSHFWDPIELINDF